MEIWKDIPGYEGLYQASTSGEIKSLFRYNKILKQTVGKNGYKAVELFKNKKGKRFSVHRLIALTFIPNPYNKPQINHIDENKVNNNIENLEWVTAEENLKHGTRLARQILHTDYTTEFRKEVARINGRMASKPVEQYSKDGAFIQRYDSAKQASVQNNLNHSHIVECCHGKRYKTVGGFVWKFERRNDLLASQF